MRSSYFCLKIILHDTHVLFETRNLAFSKPSVHGFANFNDTLLFLPIRRRWLRVYVKNFFNCESGECYGSRVVGVRIKVVIVFLWFRMYDRNRMWFIDVSMLLILFLSLGVHVENLIWKSFIVKINLKSSLLFCHHFSNQHENNYCFLATCCCFIVLVIMFDPVLVSDKLIVLVHISFIFQSILVNYIGW